MPKRKKTKAADYEYLGRATGQTQATTEYASEMNPETKVTKAKPKGQC
ncbi:MAG: hypothetical protein ACM3ZC_16375 [Bacteroidota bacterium]